MKPNQTIDQRQKGKKACIWTQAGVVHHKYCLKDYNCASCRFDNIMRKVAKENRNQRQRGIILSSKKSRIVYWQDRLKEQPSWKRPCLHHMKGRINFRACTNNYRCNDCDFNQYFFDQYTVHAVVKPVDVLKVEGFKIPQGFYFHPGHTWVKLEEGKTVRVGIDDFAFRLLGPPDKIESPLVGKEVFQNQPGIFLKRGKNTANFQSPITGIVTDINPILRENGSIASRNPYDDGWIMRVHATNLRLDLKHLIIGKESGKTISKEVDKLYELIEETAGPLAADGGYLCDDLFGNMPEIGWSRLTQLIIKM